MVLLPANAGCEVEFCEAVARTIPPLIKLLDDKAKEVRWETVKLIGKLANHGK